LHLSIQEHGKVFLRQSQARHPNFATTTNLAKTMDMHKFFLHASDAYSHWNALSQEQRQQTWQREILRSFARAEEARREAQNTIDSLRRQIDQLSLQLEQGTTNWNGFEQTQRTTGQSPYAALSSVKCSDNLMRELCKQGVDFRDWDYERLVDKWKPVVREERKAAHGLGEQKPLSEASQPRHTSNSTNLHLPNGQPSAFPPFPRSASSATTAPPTRTGSMDSASRDDEDAEGEEDDGGIDHSTPSAQIRTELHQQQQRHPQHPQHQIPQIQTTHQSHQSHQHEPPNNHFPSPAGQTSPVYQWSGQPGLANQGRMQIKNLPPGPQDWGREFNHAVMEGIEGPGGVGGMGQSSGI
jgi:hypothetical protein